MQQRECRDGSLSPEAVDDSERFVLYPGSSRPAHRDLYGDMLSNPPFQRMPRFRFRREKAAEAIEVIAHLKPGLTQYFVGKFLYLADKAHFLDWGRPITFDRYVAMKHGPVPSAVRNMLAAAAGVDAGMDEDRLEMAEQDAAALQGLVRVDLEYKRNGELQKVFPAGDLRISHLSETDVECLQAAVGESGAMGFGDLRESTHQDEAWREAWSRANGRVADIDITLWAEEKDRAAFRRQLLDYGAFV